MKKEQGYQPTPEEVSVAEGTMSETQRRLSEIKESLTQKYQASDPDFLKKIKYANLYYDGIRNKNEKIERQGAVGQINGHEIRVVERHFLDNNRFEYEAVVDGVHLLPPEEAKKIWKAYSIIADFKREEGDQALELELAAYEEQKNWKSDQEMKDLLVDLLPDQEKK